VSLAVHGYDCEKQSEPTGPGACPRIGGCLKLLGMECCCETGTCDSQTDAVPSSEAERLRAELNYLQTTGSSPSPFEVVEKFDKLSKENERLRAENAELRRQVEQLTADAAALRRLAEKLIEDVDTLEFYYYDKEEYESLGLEIQYTDGANGPVVIKSDLGKSLLDELAALRQQLHNLNQHCEQFFYLCERCGGCGKQEVGHYDANTREYDSPAGVCRLCNGIGWLGLKDRFSQQKGG
jgi:hypothetical protein